MKINNSLLGKEMFKEVDGITYKLCTKCLQYKPMSSEYFYKRDNASVDRINPGEDYSLSNIRLVCNHVNMMRSNLSDEQLIEFCKAIVENNG